MFCIDRNKHLPYWHKLIKQGGFWGRIAESAMYADPTNLEILVTAFPKLIEGQASEKRRWTPVLYISKTESRLVK